jgi:hypothetical protein
MNRWLIPNSIGEVVVGITPLRKSKTCPSISGIFVFPAEYQNLQTRRLLTHEKNTINHADHSRFMFYEARAAERHNPNDLP